MYDILVIGGNSGGCFAALTAAKLGKSVALSLDNEILLSDFCATLNTAMPAESAKLFSELGIEPECTENGKAVFLNGKMRQSALKTLLKYGVTVLYNSAPVAALVSNKRVCGALLATKYGTAAVNAGAVLDCSGSFGKLLGGKTVKIGPSYYTVECDNVKINTPSEFNGIIINKSLHTDSSVFLSFKTSDNLVSARKSAIYSCRRMAKSIDWFKDYSINNIALETHMQEKISAPNRPGFYFAQYTLNCFSSAEEYNAYFEMTAEEASCAASGAKAAKPLFAEAYGKSHSLKEISAKKSLKGELKFPLYNFPEYKYRLTKDVAVAGCGAGGSAAAVALAGVSSIIIDINSMPGGTRTIGLVPGFWHGYKSDGFAINNRLKSDETVKKYRLPLHLAEAFNIERTLESNKTEMLYHSIVYAVKTENSKAVSLFAVNKNGVYKIDFNILIDATGDADAAVAAGEKYTYGDRRDGVTQGYSVWGEEAPHTHFFDSKYRGDPDSLYGDYYSDMLRGTYIGQLETSPQYFTPFMTVRESRHICGKYTLKLRDLIAEKCYSDTIAVASSLFDTHGIGSAPVCFTGLFDCIRPFKGTPDIEMRIPYRAILPKHIRGMMVISKAISADRDAASMVRMNADIENLGYAAGLLAAKAVQSNLLPDEVSPKLIYPELLQQKTLPEWYRKKARVTSKSLIESIKSGDKKAILYAAASGKFGNKLLAEFKNCEESEKYNLAVALAGCGMADGAEILLNRLNTIAENTNFSGGEASTLIMLLSRLAAAGKINKSKYEDALVKFILIVESGGGYGKPERGIYQNSKVSNRTIPRFGLLIALCSAVDITASKSFIEPLEALAKKKYINPENDEIFTVQLYLRIAAAAARCGSSWGAEVLQSHTNDKRAFFKNFACSELKSIFKTPAPIKMSKSIFDA